MDAPPTKASAMAQTGGSKSAATKPADEADGQHDVGELGGLQGHVGALEDLVELLPVPEIAEHALGRLEERHEDRHLAALSARA